MAVPCSSSLDMNIDVVDSVSPADQDLRICCDLFVGDIGLEPGFLEDDDVEIRVLNVVIDIIDCRTSTGQVT